MFEKDYLPGPAKVVVVCRTEDVMASFGLMNERIAKAMEALREFIETIACQDEEQPIERDILEAMHKVIDSVLLTYPVNISQMDADIVSLRNLRISNKTFADVAAEEERHHA